jgi:O-antigen ligase
VVLIVLSDLNWVAAFRRLITRVAFWAAPLSIVFIRYYPRLGRAYTHNGSPTWTGIATDKNALGMICLVCGLASIFRFLQLYCVEKGARQRRPLIAHGIIIVMSLFLLWEANSATASACFVLAAGPMVLTYMYAWARKPAWTNILVFSALGIAFSALFLNFGTGMVEDLGRNSTLTGRTNIWHFALGMVQNPMFGTGFESFWLGARLEEMKVLMNQGINQAHNGYIEIYLNLGWIGVALLATILITGYRRILVAVREMAPMASLRLAYFIVGVAYNFTEAGFKMMHPVWLSLLLVTMIVPELQQQEEPPSPGIRPLEEITKVHPRPTRSAVRIRQTVRT